jgi:hypothetical protein
MRKRFPSLALSLFFTGALFAQDCTITFDATCPDVTPECNAAFAGGGSCQVAGMPFCYDTGLFAYEVTDGAPLTITLSHGISELDVFFAQSAGSGTMSFFNVAGDSVGTALTPNGDCGVSMPPRQTVVFDDVVTRIEVEADPGGRLWIDTFGVTFAPAVSVVLTPPGTPIVIPPEGGSYQYRLQMFNNTDTLQTFDTWITIDGPGLNRTFGPRAFSLDGGRNFGAALTQVIPGGAPAGLYTHSASVGTVFPVADDSDSFTWEKAASAARTWSVAGDATWRPSFLTGEASPAEVVPDGFALDANYPNPFNPRTVIRYVLPEAGRATLKVYDVLGETVTTLADGYHAAGSYQVVFDATGLSAGTYIYRLRAEGFTATRRMTLLK